MGVCVCVCGRPYEATDHQLTAAVAGSDQIEAVSSRETQVTPREGSRAWAKHPQPSPQTLHNAHTFFTSSVGISASVLGCVFSVHSPQSTQ